MNKLKDLTARERQIMDAVYKLGEATAVAVMDMIPDAGSNSTIRTQLSRLVEKGFLKQKREGKKYIFTPSIDIVLARKSALHDLLDTFFKNSAAPAVIALLDESKVALSEHDKRMILKKIEEAEYEDR